MRWILLLMASIPPAGFLAWLGLKVAVWFAIRSGKREVSLFYGLVQLVLYRPLEGLVILRNMRLYDGGVIQDTQGGMILISGLFGQELWARVPLNLRQMEWSDKNVLTRDSIRVGIRLAILWRVIDLRQFVFGLDSAINVDRTHREVGPTQAAESWLRVQTEGVLRSIVSHTGTGLLISSKATRYLHEAHGAGDDPPIASNTSESLATNLGIDLNLKCKHHGIEVRQIEIQEVSLPAEIQKMIESVWEARLLPVKTEQEARAEQIKLQRLAEVLGIETVRASVVMQSFKGSYLNGGMPQFIEALLSGAGTSPIPGPAAVPALTPPDDDPERRLADLI